MVYCQVFLDFGIAFHSDIAFQVRRAIDGQVLADVLITLGEFQTARGHHGLPHQLEIVLSPIADRVIRMHDGKVTAVDVNEHPMDIAELEW